MFGKRIEMEKSLFISLQESDQFETDRYKSQIEQVGNEFLKRENTIRDNYCELLQDFERSLERVHLI